MSVFSWTAEVWWLYISFFLYRRRDTYLQKGKALLKEGRDSEANECFRKGVDVTPEMALALIKVRSHSQ